MQEDGAFYQELIAAGLKDQVNEILSQEDCDCDPEFLGFSDIYKHLAEIIPTDRAVLDFGCAFAFQSFYFRNHRAYIGIDPGHTKRFGMPNSTFYKMVTSRYIHEMQYGNDTTWPGDPVFTICSYVPPWYGEDSSELVRRVFPDVFTYYPRKSGNDPWLGLIKG